MRVSPAPIREPIADWKTMLVGRNWAVYFRQLDAARMVAGLHAARTTAGQYPDGMLYFESDRTVFYVHVNGTWRYLSGKMVGEIGDRPDDLGEGDFGFEFYLDDWSAYYIWDGTDWQDGP